MFDLNALCDEDFIKNYWKKDFFVWKNVISDFSFNYDELNSVINNNDLSVEDLRLVNSNQFFNMQSIVEKVGINSKHKLNKNTIIDNQKLSQVLSSRDYSIRFYALTRYSRKVRQFALQLEDVSDRRCDTVAIYTPANSVCFDWHADDFEGFAAQCEGDKLWRFKDPNNPEEIREVLLEKGDVVYFPEGLEHYVESKDSDSLHITFGLRPLELKEMVLAMMDKYELKLFNDRFNYSNEHIGVDKQATANNMSIALMELLKLFKSKGSVDQMISLMLRGREKGRDFIDLPLFPMESLEKKAFQFVNIDEWVITEEPSGEMTVVFRGKCLKLLASGELKNLIKSGKIMDYNKVMKVLGANDLEEMIACQFLRVIN